MCILFESWPHVPPPRKSRRVQQVVRQNLTVKRSYAKTITEAVGRENTKTKIFVCKQMARQQAGREKQICAYQAYCTGRSLAYVRIREGMKQKLLRCCDAGATFGSELLLCITRTTTGGDVRLPQPGIRALQPSPPPPVPHHHRMYTMYYST